MNLASDRDRMLAANMDAAKQGTISKPSALALPTVAEKASGADLGKEL